MHTHTHTHTDNDIQCGSVKYGLRVIIAALPAWFRFAQCLRRYYNTKLAFPHLVNAGKYSTTFFVVFFGSVSSGLRGGCVHVNVGMLARYVYTQLALSKYVVCVCNLT